MAMEEDDESGQGLEHGVKEESDMAVAGKFSEWARSSDSECI